MAPAYQAHTLDSFKLAVDGLWFQKRYSIDFFGEKSIVFDDSFCNLKAGAEFFWAH
jgi:hypothetical protein